MFDVREFLNGLNSEARKRAEAAGVRAVNRFGEHVIGQAQVLTPVKTGALNQSATTQPARLTRSDISKVVGFNTDYAAAVHERLDLHHDQGQAKFLETAMRKEARKLLPFVESEMRRALQ